MKWYSYAKTNSKTYSPMGLVSSGGVAGVDRCAEWFGSQDDRWRDRSSVDQCAAIFDSIDRAVAICTACK